MIEVSAHSVPLPSDLAALIERHDRGLEARDVAFMKTLLPQNFLQVTPAGTLKGRAEWFEWFENIARYDVMRRAIVSARKFDGTFAVLSWVNPMMRVRDGESSEHSAMMLEIWTSRAGTWVKGYEQYTRPPQPAA